MYAFMDIGGTKTRVAVSADGTTMSEPVIFETPHTYGEAIARMAGEMVRLAAGATIDLVIAGKRGLIAHDGRSVVRDVVFPQWDGKPLADDIEWAAGAKGVRIVNDAALVGLGEAVYGAGKGAQICAYLTVSTGINGARIIDGAIDVARDGFEIGGAYLSVSPLQTLEELVSGAAVEKRFGMHPRDIGKDNPFWEEAALFTAVGVHNAVMHWSPDVVVLGGSMFSEVGISVERVRAHLVSLTKKFPSPPPVARGTLGDIGGLYGGMAYIQA